MPRKKIKPPQKWETKSKKTFSRIYTDMLLSEAYTSLTNNQKILYIAMKDQFYGKHKPQKDHPDLAEQMKDDDFFYFNHTLGIKYGLYAPTSKTSFYRDIRVLEEHGFIITFFNGKSGKTKSIYRFSDKWKAWKKENQN